MVLGVRNSSTAAQQPDGFADVQTSGSEPPTPISPLSRSAFDTAHTVFRIPAELVVKILTYFGDPHRNILSVKGYSGSYQALSPKHIERLTVMRKLTVTCWHLRNMLFPLLWEYVAGCKVLLRGRIGNDLRAQCAYLILNPAIGAYVRCVYSLTN